MYKGHVKDMFSMAFGHVLLSFRHVVGHVRVHQFTCPFVI
jgi:hypothetical protein